MVLAHAGCFNQISGSPLRNNSSKLIFFFLFILLHKTKIKLFFGVANIGFCINIKPQYVDCTAMAIMIKLSPLFFQKKPFQHIQVSILIHLPCIYKKVTCYRSAVTTSIYLYEQQFPHTDEISCWRWYS